MFCAYNAECSFAHQIRLELHDIRNGFSEPGPFRHKVMRSIPRTVLDNHHDYCYTQPKTLIESGQDEFETDDGKNIGKPPGYYVRLKPIRQRSP